MTSAAPAGAGRVRHLDRIGTRSRSSRSRKRSGCRRATRPMSCAPPWRARCSAPASSPRHIGAAADALSPTDRARQDVAPRNLFALDRGRSSRGAPERPLVADDYGPQERQPTANEQPRVGGGRGDRSTPRPGAAEGLGRLEPSETDGRALSSSDVADGEGVGLAEPDPDGEAVGVVLGDAAGEPEGSAARMSGSAPPLGVASVPASDSPSGAGLRSGAGWRSGAAWAPAWEWRSAGARPRRRSRH